MPSWDQESEKSCDFDVGSRGSGLGNLQEGLGADIAVTMGVFSS